MAGDVPQEERDELLATMLQQGQVRDELRADAQLNAIVGARLPADGSLQTATLPMPPPPANNGTVGLSELLGGGGGGGGGGEAAAAPDSEGSVYRCVCKLADVERGPCGQPCDVSS
eukprot:SAG22_NODE_2996_length_2040_cov_2.528594_1_plen_116_part_00